MNHYEEKKQARIDRLRAAAQKAEKESTQLYDQAHKMAGMIPFGQPIIAGHHSEGRDRRYRGRIQSKLEKAFAAQDKAKEYASRAAAAESNTAISSDDPEAVVKLREKLVGLEKLQETMKAANKIIKRKTGAHEVKIAELEALGIKDPARLFEPDFCGRIGFPDYAITNNGAEIRRCKKRIEEMVELSERYDCEYMIGEIRVHEDPNDNRLKIFFPTKPGEEIRSMLKSNGFRWSPYNRAWQRQLNGFSKHALENIKEKLK